jgi:hypothetical protein
MRLFKSSKTRVGICAAVLIGGATAQATTIDLTTTSSGELNGGLFSTIGTQPTGSGVFDPFLTIQNNVTEQGYNSAVGNFDTKRDPVYNHEIKLSQLNTTTIGGVQYFTFNVDINEPNGGSKALISLDSFRVYTSPTLQSSTSTDANGLFNGSLGTLRYDSGSGNLVKINDINHGSGQADLAVFIPASDFAGASADDNVYVYQYWGKEFNTQGGYEETAIGAGTAFTSVPEVSSLLPLMGMLGAVGGFHYFRRRQAGEAESAA